MYVPTGSVPVGDKNSPMFGESSDPLKSRSVLAWLAIAGEHVRRVKLKDPVCVF